MSRTATVQQAEPLRRLRTLYENDRAARDQQHPPLASHGQCRYCGRPWFRYGGTAFEGHATCIVSTEFQGDVVAILDCGVSFAELASCLGVSPSIVRAWWHGLKQSPQGGVRRVNANNEDERQNEP